MEFPRREAPDRSMCCLRYGHPSKSFAMLRGARRIERWLESMKHRIDIAKASDRMIARQLRNCHAMKKGAGCRMANIG